MSWPVVVGVDGTVSALRAVQWAALHASRHVIDLRLVHAEHPYREEHVTRLLRTAEAVANENGLAVTVVRAAMSPAELLVRESGSASLVVLGSAGHGGFTGRLLGTTVHTLAARGRCPIVVMAGAGDPGRGPVVVGTDGTETSDAALAFAYGEAAVRATDLLVVQSWTPGVDRADDAAAVVADRVESLQGRHPEVKVRHEVVPEAPGEALLDRAAGAQLVVVGSRRRVGYRGPVLRATGHLLLHRAPCPVAVVRWDHLA